ncbi:MAG: DPP IV N-terminal domain-containing protein [Phycisphaeraceae bacterium]
MTLRWMMLAWMSAVLVSVAVLAGGCAHLSFDGLRAQRAPAVTPANPSPAVQASAPAVQAVGAFSLFGQLPVSPAATGGGGDRAADAPDNLRQVTFAIEGSDFDPDIDATGQLIVFASTRHRHTSDIYLQSVRGTSVTRLTDDQANDAMPAFSLDGKSIAFASDRSGNWDIYIMPVDGGQPVQVTSDPAQDIHPSFSPDGKSLVYSTQSPQSGQWDMVLVEVTKPGNKRFLGTGLFPSWSPAGNRIVFQRARERGTRWFGIWTVDIENGEGVRPTEVAASSNAACISPRWSPDGRHVVFCTVVDPEAPDQGQGPGAGALKQADIWIINADGSGRSNLTHNQFVNVQPVWAGDGLIYFVSSRTEDQKQSIWSLRPARSMLMAGQTPAAGSQASVGATP